MQQNNLYVFFAATISIMIVIAVKIMFLICINFFINFLINPLFFQDELLDLLINICKSSDDDQICLLAGKIFLYYAETPKVRSFVMH